MIIAMKVNQNDDIMGYKDHVTGSTNQEVVQVASGTSDDSPCYTNNFPKSGLFSIHSSVVKQR